MSAITTKTLFASALFFGAATTAISAQAAVTLTVDDHIKVTAINGQELKQSPFAPLTKTFTLQPGKHVITAKYDRLYKLRRDEHDYLRSGNISVAAELADNQTYRLSMPGQPEAYRAAKEYSEQPTLAVQQGNTIIAQQQSIGDNSGGIFSGLSNALGGVFGGGGDAKAQNQNAIAALDTPATTAVTRAPAVKTGSTAPQSTSTLDDFMQLWLAATPAEREKIRQWIQK